MNSRNNTTKSTNQFLNYLAMELILGLEESMKFIFEHLLIKHLKCSPHKHQALYPIQ